MGSKHLLDDYARVTDSNPCPVCGRPDWCLIHNSGRGAICQRVESAIRKKNAGWYHDVEAYAPPVLVPKAPKLDPRAVSRLVDMMPMVRQEDADQLGIPLAGLRSLRAKYSLDRDAVLFPMEDGQGRWVGGRYRAHTGAKWSIRGATEGVFTTSKPITSFAIVTEGPTDTAAVAALGLPAVGRPSCNGGLDEIKRLVPEWAYLLILADPDGPGVKGARDFARRCERAATVLQSKWDARDFIRKVHADPAKYFAAGLVPHTDRPWKPIFRNVASVGYPLDAVINDILLATPLT
jgi:5S rRNA maturation endonuclease (ribonuclease M5)